MIIKNFYQFLLERNDLSHGDYLYKHSVKIVNEYIIHLCDLFSDKFENKNNVISNYLFEFSYKLDDTILDILFLEEYTDPNVKAKYIIEKNYITIHNEFIYERLEKIEDAFENDDEEIAKKNIIEISEYKGWEAIRKAISHELVHHLDKLKGGLNTTSYDKINNILNKFKNHVEKNAYISSDAFKELKTSLYYNSTEEYNAFFLEAISSFLSDVYDGTIWYGGKDVIRKFNDFKTLFFEKYYKIFNDLNEDTKKRVLKRMYSFYKAIMTIDFHNKRFDELRNKGLA